MKTAVLLDTSAIMYRAFYSLTEFRNSKGEPTGAILGFTNIVNNILEEFKPDYVVAALDVTRKSLKRTKEYDEYKANRKPMPEDLLAQFGKIKDLLDYLGIKKYQVEGEEADDVLGTLAKKFSDQGVKVIIATGDKDLSQVIDENISVGLLGKGQGKSKLKLVSTDEDVIEQLGVRANLIPDLFGLIGDTSDGIPGVRKVGTKKAVPMLEKYGNLEEIYNNVDELIKLPGIGKGLVKNIEEDRELAFLSKKLATINLDVDLEFNLEENLMIRREKELFEFFKELEFRALINKMGLSEGSEEKVAETKKELIIVKSDEEFKSLEEELNREKKVAVYYNKSGLSFGIEDKTYYVSIDHRYLGAVNFEIERVKELLKSNSKFIGYKFKEMLTDGFYIENTHFDTLIANFLLTSITKEEIEIVLSNELGIELKNYKDSFAKKTPYEVTIEEMAEYSTDRVSGILSLYPVLEEKLENENLTELFFDMEMKLIKVLSSMERNGIKIDREYFNKYNGELLEKLDKLKTLIYGEADEEFNINSPKQLGEILFLKLNIEPVKKTKTGFSTSAEVLEILASRGEKIAEYILEYRKLAKLQNTYVETLPKLADSDDLIHTTFNQTGAATGRLSSSDPNLQNIPVKSDEGIKIRAGFVAHKGYKLVSFDYSQIELRVLAEISKEENLVRAYEEDLDLHDLTARNIFSLEESEEVTRAMRTMAKIVNFSIIYGKTPFGLSKELGITVGEASTYIKRYFETYPKVKELEQEIIAKTQEKAEVRTLFGRKRVIGDINSKNRNSKSQAERMAVNTVIQGTAADILKVTMIKLFEEVQKRDDIKMLLQVHDELVFEIKEEKLDECCDLIRDIMENSVKFENVNLKSNMAVGDNWSEAK